MKILDFTIPILYDKSVLVEKVCQPFYYPYLHRHKEVQLTWVQKGNGTLIAGNTMHDYTAGDIFFIGANMPHVFKSSPEYFDMESREQVEAITLFFNPDGLLSDTFNLSEMAQSAAFIKQHQQGFKIPSYARERVSAGMLSLHQQAGIDQLMHFFLLIITITEIKGKLEPLSAYGTYPAITDRKGSRIAGIYNYIMLHYGEDLSLEEVARIAFMTPESFCRYFKKHTGKNFVAFLNEVRINEACKKMTTQRYEAINIMAYKCGFRSMTNFNRVFKLIIGVTPKAYLEHYVKHTGQLNRFMQN